MILDSVVSEQPSEARCCRYNYLYLFKKLEFVHDISKNKNKRLSDKNRCNYQVKPLADFMELTFPRE
jgi:hypothetical protein